MLPIKVDAKSGMPIHKQISEQVAGLIKVGQLAAGEQLPAERELAEALSVARGTVKKAYETLVYQKLIVVARGRGSVVAQSVHSAAEGRQGLAAQRVRETILALEDMRFSHHEIADLFGLMLARRQEELAGFTIAAVDCNPEALGIYQKQLAMLTHMSIARIMLKELRETGVAETILAPFDLILTTVNHIEELQQLAPRAGKKAVPVMVSPTQGTLISLARLESSARVGILYLSERFREIISGWLRKSGFRDATTAFAAEHRNIEGFAGFVSQIDVLILPPGYAAQLPGSMLQVLNHFRLNGGQLIDFDYQIERGSLMHLEELIKTLLLQPRK